MLELTGREKRFLVFIALAMVLLSGAEYLVKCYRLGLAANLEAEVYNLETNLKINTYSELENTNLKENEDSEISSIVNTQEGANATTLEPVAKKDPQETYLNLEVSEKKAQDLPPQQPFIINLNTATFSELIKIPGIGPVLAERILKYREENQRFLSLEELREVKGIGAKTLEKIKPYLTL